MNEDYIFEGVFLVEAETLIIEFDRLRAGQLVNRIVGLLRLYYTALDAGQNFSKETTEIVSALRDRLTPNDLGL